MTNHFMLERTKFKKHELDCKEEQNITPFLLSTLINNTVCLSLKKHCLLAFVGSQTISKRCAE